MTDCARCGDCCERIWISSQAVVTVDFYRDNGTYPDGSSIRPDGNVEFIAKHWTEIERVYDSTDGLFLQGARYSCDQFDTVHRTCAAHEGRPPVCRDFPWYGHDPADGPKDISISKRCSYWADVPTAERPEGVRPLLPIAVIR